MKRKLDPAIRLRIAAKDWADGLHMPVTGSRDDGFRKLDRRLQRAALAYAKATSATTIR